VVIRVAGNTNRLRSVDICRGLAVFFMICADVPIIFFSVNSFMEIFAAPFFLIIAGLSYEFFLVSRVKKGFSSDNTRLEAFSRAIIIYLIPLTFFFVGTVLFPERYPFQIVHWGVFQVIGVGYILGFVLLDDWKAKIGMITSIFLLSFIFQTYFYETFRFLLQGFGVIPWINYFIFGTLIFEIYRRGFYTRERAFIFSWVPLLILSCGAIGAMHVDFCTSTRNQWPVFLFLSSIMLILVSCLIVVVDRKGLFRTLLAPFESMGRIAFSIYYSFFAVVLAMEFVNSYYPFPPASYFISVVLIVAASVYVEKIWAKYEYRYGLEWCLRFFSEKLRQGWLARKQ
jgi:hypothetical protein